MAQVMRGANKLLTKLQAGNGPAFGAWQMLPGTNISRVIARQGFDWVCVDCEHGNIADHEMHEAVAAIASCGVSPIVRIPANVDWMVKRALDAGAHGLVVPLIYTVDDAKQLAANAKFPPVGRRGFGSPFSMGMFDVQGKLSQLDYKENANENLVTCVQIETLSAFQQVEEIAKVEGIDVLLIGPFDLGNNIGYPVRGEFAPELKEAIAKILKATHDAGKKCAVYATDGDQARMYADQGFDMISVLNDMTALPMAMAEGLAKAKGSWGHAAGQAVKGAATSAATLVSGATKKEGS